MVWKYGDRVIKPGRSWTDSTGTQHPGNWHIWSKAEKDAMNITEVIEESPPDSRLYFWSRDGNGKITSTPKPLDDSGSGIDKVLGLKSTLKNEVKDQQGSLLSQTDWAYIRHYDTGTDVPSNIETWRNAIRAKATEMENAIDASDDTDAIAALLMSFDVDANPLSKFKEAAAKTLGVTILSIKEIEALTPEQKTAYDSDLEKINTEATSKRDIEMKKYPFLSVWPELGE